MNKYASGIAVLTLTLAFASWASVQRAVDEARDVKADGIVEITNTAGSINVVAWDRPVVHVTGELERNIERVDFEVRDGRTSVRVIRKAHARRDAAAFLTVSLPASAALEIEGVSADVQLEDAAPAQPDRPARATVRIKTVSGSIRAITWANTVELKSVSGDVSFAGAAETFQGESTSGRIECSGAHSVELHTVSGEIRCAGAVAAKMRSTSGSLTAADIGRELEATTISGEIEAGVSAIERVSLRSISGSVELKGVLAPAGRVDVSTQSGSVGLGLSGDVSAEFQLSSVSGGIRTDFGLSGGRLKGSVNFSTGNGDGYVRVSTTSGSISISEA